MGRIPKNGGGTFIPNRFLMVKKALIYSKKKKIKCVYLEDLNIPLENEGPLLPKGSKKKFFYKINHVFVGSSTLGVSALLMGFPKKESLNNFVFYAPICHNIFASTSIVLKQVKLFLKGLSQGFFLEFRLIGLGFKVKKAASFGTRILNFDIGFSHFKKLAISRSVRLYRVKRRFMLFSNDYIKLKITLKQIQNLRKHNPYKLRGLKLSGVRLRVKSGKKQTRR